MSACIITPLTNVFYQRHAISWVLIKLYVFTIGFAYWNVQFELECCVQTWDVTRRATMRPRPFGAALTAITPERWPLTLVFTKLASFVHHVVLDIYLTMSLFLRKYLVLSPPATKSSWDSTFMHLIPSTTFQRFFRNPLRRQFLTLAF